LDIIINKDVMKKSRQMEKKFNIWAKIILILIFSNSLILSGQELGEKKATPQRPSFTTNAFTTYPGAFETESGVSSSDESLNTTVKIKYGAGLNLEIFVAFTPYLRLYNPDTLGYEWIKKGVGEGIGDTYVGARYRFWTNFYEEKMLAVQLHAKIPTAKKIVWIPTGGLGTGETDFTGFLIFTNTKEKYQFDMNLGVTLAGKYWESGLERQLFGTICFTRIITRKFSIMSDLYAYEYFEQEEGFKKKLSSYALFGVNYAIKPTIILDAAINFGFINSLSYNWQFATGITITL
jgi:hypothetical protein